MNNNFVTSGNEEFMLCTWKDIVFILKPIIGEVIAETHLTKNHMFAAHVNTEE